MNVIIDIGEKKPIEGDLLVFKNGKWETTNHEAVFKSELDEIRQLDAKADELTEKVKEMSENLSRMAEIIKENLI